MNTSYPDNAQPSAADAPWNQPDAECCELCGMEYEVVTRGIALIQCETRKHEPTMLKTCTDCCVTMRDACEECLEGADVANTSYPSYERGAA